MPVNISTEIKSLLSALDNIENAIQQLPEDIKGSSTCQSLGNTVKNNTCQLLELNTGNIRNIILQRMIPLVWGLENGLHISVPQDINNQSTDTLIDTPKKKWAELVPNDNSHEGGRLIIYTSNKDNPTIILLTAIEYSVLSKFQDITSSNLVPLKLDTISLPFSVKQIRSAFYRVIGKLKEAECPWVLTNIKRRGYVLKMKQDDEV